MTVLTVLRDVFTVVEQSGEAAQPTTHTRARRYAEEVEMEMEIDGDEVEMEMEMERSLALCCCGCCVCLVRKWEMENGKWKMGVYVCVGGGAERSGWPGYHDHSHSLAKTRPHDAIRCAALAKTRPQRLHDAMRCDALHSVTRKDKTAKTRPQRLH